MYSSYMNMHRQTTITTSTLSVRSERLIIIICVSADKTLSNINMIRGPSLAWEVDDDILTITKRSLARALADFGDVVICTTKRPKRIRSKAEEDVILVDQFLRGADRFRHELDDLHTSSNLAGRISTESVFLDFLVTEVYKQ